MKCHAAFRNVPNNEEGRLFRKLVRKYLNPNLEATTRGLAKERKRIAAEAGVELNHTGDIPVRLAERWHIYIDTKFVAKVDRSKLDCRGRGKWYYKDTFKPRPGEWWETRWIGVFKTAEAAAAAYIVANGVKEKS